MSQFRTLVESFRTGRMDRRTFLAAAAAIGAVPAIAQAVAAQTEESSRPAFGAEDKERGQDGRLRVIIWQAPTGAASHSALSDKDYLAAAPVIEPLMHYGADGSLIANLIEAVPSVESGTLAEDASWCDLTLLEGLLWSDGEPVTSNDITFTWQWVTTASNAATSASAWANIESIEAVDDRTVHVTFANPVVTWFEPFAGSYDGNLYPAHAFDNDPTNKNDAFVTAPLGTGPFVIESFVAGDSATYVANPNYREPNKPAFARLELKGGGDAAAAARSVLQTEDMDYAWNVQVEPAVLQQMVADGSVGNVYAAGGTTVEGVNFNFSDPHTEVDGQRSQKDTSHPIFSDPAVRQALSMAVPRQLIADELYAPGEEPTSNVLAGLASFDSPNTSWIYDLDAAAATLDTAGWTWDGEVRQKDGVALEFTLMSSVSSVRQKTQAIIQDSMKQIGVRVNIDSVDAGIFFDSSAGNDQNFYHMYWDADLWTNGPYSPIPVTWMNRWYAGPDGENIAQKENEWQRDNTQRYRNPEYDAAYEALLLETDADAALEGLIALNDILIGDVVQIPIVNRSVGTYALANRIRNENLANGPSFVLPFWNIANWNLNDGFDPL
ncbi:MAG: peptide ABC transporter substrate-binding protein [Thermomicrobiales bacterium]|nr:peptide ABC transporter substrate-binding protein [Thermomicrobiales bacterium]